MTVDSELPGSVTRPAVPAKTQECFLPLDFDLQRAASAARRSLPPGSETLGLIYRPALLGQAEAVVRNRKYNVDSAQQRAALVPEPDRRGMVRWEDFPITPREARRLESRPAPDGRFAELEPPLTDERSLRDLEKDFADWAYRTTEVKIRANETLKVYGGPEEPATDFAARCRAAADEAMRAEAQKTADGFDRRIDSIEEKLRREQRELEEDQAELSGRQREELLTHAQTLFSLFSRKRASVSSSMTKRRMTSKAKAEVEESEQAIAAYQRQLEELHRDAEAALQEVQARWARVADECTEIPLQPLKKDVRTTFFGVAWCPYYLVRLDGRIAELAAFDAA